MSLIREMAVEIFAASLGKRQDDIFAARDAFDLMASMPVTGAAFVREWEDAARAALAVLSKRSLGKYVAPVRRGEKGDWISRDEIGLTDDDAKIALAITDAKIPDWSKAHPVQRIARIFIVEET